MIFREYAMSLKKSVCLVSIIIAMNGCARSQELITSGSISTRTDVFTEISGTEILPGQAALYIYTSFKKADHSSVLLDHNKLGSSDVTLLINIDGQALQLKGSVRTEKRKAKGLHDPEAGEGLRYIFTTEVQLPAGSHRIIVALPAGGIAVEREINLAVG
jgi:hypothetical protein